ncbi:hypothetical protein [Mycoplasmopsis felifaucium]|nr:hypothetical protein [Mycoplasmopsis felifaucium]
MIKWNDDCPIKKEELDADLRKYGLESQLLREWNKWMKESHPEDLKGTKN